MGRSSGAFWEVEFGALWPETTGEVQSDPLHHASGSLQPGPNVILFERMRDVLNVTGSLEEIEPADVVEIPVSAAAVLPLGISHLGL